MVKGVARLVSRILGLLGIVIVAWAGWKWGDAVFPRIEERLGLGAEKDQIVVEDGEASEALGAETLARIEDFLDGGDEELTLTGPQITSILRYERASLVPAGVERPTVRLEDGRAYASADLALAEFPALPDLGPITGMLPDMVSLELSGSVMGFGDGDAALVVQGIELEGIPLPRATIPEVLTALGRTERPGLPKDAVAVELPDGVESAHVDGDLLVLVAQR